MVLVYRLIAQAARTDVNVLITGESGTGKELVTRAIHDFSARKHRPFLSVNCSGLTDTLLEAELFGHTRNAFTGAERDRSGPVRSRRWRYALPGRVGFHPSGLSGQSAARSTEWRSPQGRFYAVAARQRPGDRAPATRLCRNSSPPAVSAPTCTTASASSASSCPLSGSARETCSY